MVDKPVSPLEQEAKDSAKSKRKTTGTPTLRAIGSFFGTILSLLIIYWLYLLFSWTFEHAKVSWIGYAIIFFTLKMRIYSFMFSEAFRLSDTTSAVHRVFHPYDYRGWKLKRMDVVKVSMFIYDPFFMLRTDWGHSVPGHNLTNYINTKMYFQKVWFSTVLQIGAGIIFIKGYLDPYPKEVFLVWASFCLLGTIITPIPHRGKYRQYWYRTWGFPYITVPDIIYYLSFGMYTRGRKSPRRFYVSVVLFTLAVVNYTIGINIDFLILRERGENLWQLLLNLVNPTEWK